MSDPQPAPSRRTTGRRALASLTILVAILMAILAGAVLLVRYGAVTPQGRRLIEARLSGLEVGRLGRLRIEGLSGDVWRDFGVRRLTLSDNKGVWLQADGLSVHWTFAPLLLRRLQIDELNARAVQVLRRPILAPSEQPAGAPPPLTLDIRSVRLRLETLPAFSVERGLFDVAGRLKLRRDGKGQTANLEARSLLHAGDRLGLQVDISRGRPVLVAAEVREARGGAIAGALGLRADRPFSVRVHAKGSASSGRLDAIVVSGPQTPVEIHGGWTAAGGVAAGRVSLTASSLTAPYARLLGPDAVAALAARRAKGGLYGVAGLVRTQNLALAALGPIDPKSLRSDRGLRLDASVADLSRLEAGFKGGRGQVQGLLSGDPSAWRFAGALSIARAAGAGLELTDISGPISMSGRNHEIAVQTSLSGAGGRGVGLLASLAGPSPRAALDLVWLSDGRLLIRKADASGAGFKLSAEGRRTLFGGLAVSGTLDAANLGLVRSGAAGALQTRWSAAQASARKPWTFTTDVRGHEIKTGFGELDRLLGGSPRVKVQGAYDGRVIAIANASLDGDKTAASAQGRLDPHGPLALRAQWRAEGPFQAGPVQIDGKASGQGEITGTLGAPRADLGADFATIDIPGLPLTAARLRLSFAKEIDGFGGDIALDAGSGYGPARASASFHIAKDGVDLSRIEADAGGVKASGGLSLRGSSPSKADLQLAVGPGAILTQGQIGGTVKLADGATPSAAVDLKAADAAFRGADLTIRNARLTASGPLSRLPFQASGEGRTPQGPLSFRGSGSYQQTAGSQQIAFDGTGRFRQVDVRTIEPIAVRLAGKDQSLRARLAFGGGRLNLDGRRMQDALSATGTLQGVDLKALDPDFAGKFDADFTLTGRGSRLDGVMNARLDGARSVDSSADVAVDGVVKALLQGDRLALDAQIVGAKSLKSSLSIELPVEASAAPLRIAIPRNRPIRGRFAADGEVKPLWDLFYGSERELAGQIHMAANLGGDLSDPQFTGQASVSGGRFDDYGTGLRLNALSLNAELKRDLVAVDGLSAKDDKDGVVSGSGSFSLARGGGSDLKLALSRFRLIDNDSAEATATGQVAVTRDAAGKVRIAGDLTLDRAQINAEAHLHPSVVTMEVVEKNLPERFDVQTSAPSSGPPVTLDVGLSAPGRVFIKGRGLNAELSLDARITGDLAQPSLQGVARIVQGSYDFAGKRFDFDEHGAIVLADSPENIRLDLSASWEQPSLTATIRIKGTAAKPEITLTSSPSLPQEEILSQVLFGSSASQLSGAQTAQLASTVTAMAGGGGFDVLGGLRQLARLDRLALGGDQTSGMTLVGGKYIADNVYIQIIGGGRQGPSAEVDWRIRRGLSLVSQIGGEFGAKLAVRWSHDLGKVRKAVAPRPGG